MTNLNHRPSFTHNEVYDASCHMHFVINVSSFSVISVNILSSHLLVRRKLLLTWRGQQKPRSWARLNVPYNLGTWVNRGSVVRNFMNTEYNATSVVRCFGRKRENFYSPAFISYKNEGIKWSHIIYLIYEPKWWNYAVLHLNIIKYSSCFVSVCTLRSLKYVIKKRRESKYRSREQ